MLSNYDYIRFINVMAEQLKKMSEDKKKLEDENTSLKKKLRLDDEAIVNHAFSSTNLFTSSQLLKEGIDCTAVLDMKPVELNSDTVNIGGNFIFPEFLKFVPEVKQCYNRLYNNWASPKGATSGHTRTGDFIFSRRNMADTKSKYHLQDVSDVDPDQGLMLHLDQFNVRCEYIFKKLLTPAEARCDKKYKDNEWGVYQPMSFTQIDTNLMRSNTMETIGIQYTVFERLSSLNMKNRYIDTNRYGKYAQKTLQSIKKAFFMLMEIANTYYDDMEDKMKAYLGTEVAANTPHLLPIDFKIVLLDGWFAEGKSTFCTQSKTTYPLQCPEFEGFIRDTNMALETSLLEWETDAENRERINLFLNNAAYIMTAFRMYNLIRTATHEQAELPILVDRSPLSRILFSKHKHYDAEKIISKYDLGDIARAYYAPLCLFMDAIQANFDTLVRVRFEIMFRVNCMNQDTWRHDKQRNYERETFQSLLEEYELRKDMYYRMYYIYPSIINTITQMEMVLSGDQAAAYKTGTLTLDLVPIDQQLAADHRKQMDSIVTRGTFLKEHNVKSLLDRLINRPEVQDFGTCPACKKQRQTILCECEF